MPDLFQLPPGLLERIVAKFEWKSYFRMQQTCHYMANLFRTSRAAKICLPDNFSLFIRDNLDFVIIADNNESFISRIKTKKAAVLDTLYGISFNNLEIYGDPDNENLLSECGQTLKRYRITSNALETKYVKVDSKEHYEELLKILKPAKVYLHIQDNHTQEETNVFEALFEAEQLKDLEIHTRLYDVDEPDVMETFLRTFQKLYMNVFAYENMEHFDHIRKILQYLRSQPLSNLHSFTYIGSCDEHRHPAAPVEEWLEFFHEFNPILLREVEHPGELGGWKTKYEFECRLGLDDRKCKLELDECHINLHFECTDAHRNNQ